MHIGVIAAGVLLVLANSASCSAQDAPRALPAGAEARHWYGWQTFTTDGIAAGLFLGGVADHQNASLYVPSALVFELGAPIVHLAHQHWEYALCSLGLRVAGPLLGGILGSQGDTETRSNDGPAPTPSARYTTIGVAIGSAAVSLFDGLVLAYDQDLAPAPQRNQLLKVEAFPSLALLPHGVLFGLSGSL